jgi:hypothetical protein
MAYAKPPSFVTPAGIAQYPRLNAPDTKFNAEGVYSVKLEFSGDEAQELSAFLDAKLQESIAEAKKNNPTKKIKEADAPYSWNDSGNLSVSFKMKASGVTKDGKPWNRKPALFDAKGKPLDPTIQVGGGSTLIINYTPSAFYTAMIGAGLSMRLEAVQVLDLKAGGGASAENFGFKEQDGFEAELEATPFTAKAAEGTMVNAQDF